jgi:hypothetical protein
MQVMAHKGTVSERFQPLSVALNGCEQPVIFLLEILPANENEFLCWASVKESYWPPCAKQDRISSCEQNYSIAFRGYSHRLRATVDPQGHRATDSPGMVYS